MNGNTREYPTRSGPGSQQRPQQRPQQQRSEVIASAVQMNGRQSPSLIVYQSVSTSTDAHSSCTPDGIAGEGQESEWILRPPCCSSSPAPNGVNTAYAMSSKWEAVFDGDSRLPSFSPEEVLRGLGVILRRLDHCESERRKDRLCNEELKKENRALKRKVCDVEQAMAEAAKGALYCAGAPKFDPSPAWEPRRMSIPEANWLQQALETLKENDPRLPEISRILGIVPIGGKIAIDLSRTRASQQWQLYYYLKHRRIYKNLKIRARGEKMQRDIAAAPAASAVDVAPMREGDAFWDMYERESDEEDFFHTE